jgi:TRAP-type transport system periplasmic protein
MKSKLVSIFVAAVFIAGFTAIGPLPTASAADLTLSHMAPAGSILDKHLTAWVEKVKKDSNGKLNIRIFPGATLINPFETFSGVEKGVADMGSSYRYQRAGAELTGLFSMFLAALPSSASGSRIVAEVWKNFPELRKEWETVKVLWINASGPAVVATTRPVRTMDDLRGLELRVPVPEAADALKALGGTPVSMTSADMVIGIKRGTVHGGLVFKEAIESFKLPVKYVTEFGMYLSSNWFLVMNLNSWNKLPAELQKVIDDSLEWGRNESIKAFDAADASAVEYGKKEGMEFIKLSAEEQAKWFKIVNDNNLKHAEALDAKGYPATKVLEFVNKIR